MPHDMIIRIHLLSQNDPIGITFTNRNENEIDEDDDSDDYLPSDEEDIKYYRYYHPDNGSTRDSGGDYPSDYYSPDPHFGPTPNGGDKSTESYDITEEEDPTDNTGVGIKNETQNNRKK